MLSFEVNDKTIVPSRNKEVGLKANVVVTSNALLLLEKNSHLLNNLSEEELKRIKLESDAKLIEITRENLRN